MKVNTLFESSLTKGDKGKIVLVNDSMQTNYKYTRTKSEGDLKDLEEEFEFKPELTPNEMLSLGVFEGKYLNDCKKEFPSNLFHKAKLSDSPDPTVNFFGVKSRKPLSEWKEKGWILGDDVRGWFQWYVRTYYGRRDMKVDAKQCARWRSFVRHKAQLEKNCSKGDFSCRKVQRQALLQWSYDSRSI